MRLSTAVCLLPVLGCLFMFAAHPFLHEGLGSHSDGQQYQSVLISEMLLIECEVIVFYADDIINQLAEFFY